MLKIYDPYLIKGKGYSVPLYKRLLVNGGEGVLFFFIFFFNYILYTCKAGVL